MKCLEKDPARRYESAAALADELERWQTRGADCGAAKYEYRSRMEVAKCRPAVAGLLTALALTVIVAVIGLCLSFNQTAEALLSAERLLYSNAVVLADRELTDGNYERTEALLQRCPKEYRGWEWRFSESSQPT